MFSGKGSLFGLYFWWKILIIIISYVWQSLEVDKFDDFGAELCPILEATASGSDLVADKKLYYANDETTNEAPSPRYDTFHPLFNLSVIWFKDVQMQFKFFGWILGVLIFFKFLYFALLNSFHWFRCFEMPLVRCQKPEASDLSEAIPRGIYDFLGDCMHVH